MSDPYTTRPWDLSSVLDLSNALSSSLITDSTNSQETGKDEGESNTSKIPTSNIRDASQRLRRIKAKAAYGLGDFDKIWQYLGVPAPQEEPLKTNSNTSNLEVHFQSKADYTSDGAIRYGQQAQVGKNVRWTDETSADEPLPGSGSEHSPDRDENAAKLTKSQRKKRNRKARQLAGAQAVTLPGTVSESEADNTIARTPAHRASTHAHSNNISHEQSHRPQLASTQSTPAKVNSSGVDKLVNVHNQQHKSVISNQISKHTTLVTQSDENAHNLRRSSQPVTKLNNEPFATPIRNTKDLQHWPAGTITNTGRMKFLPSTVSPNNNTTKDQSQTNFTYSDQAAQAVQAVQLASRNISGQPTPTRSDRTHIVPKIVRSGEDRHWALFLKLLEQFSEDRKYMVAPMNMTTHNNDAAGIHIFVDASNIFIGFHDQLKLARQIPLSTRVPQVHLSFDALALLMERRRPVAKRVLVGSTPHLPAFDKAKAVGYECNVLEKVYKARELTERQIYFRDIDQQRNNGSASKAAIRHAAAAYNSGPESGSEMTASAPQYASARNVEQGVDEILHLKILESVVDSETPSTMVLATGDAAQAEYSGGFMAMAERALKKGWKVELVSWSKNISSMYLRPRFRDLWKDNFRVIFLDDYAEELLDM